MNAVTGFALKKDTATAGLVLRVRVMKLFSRVFDTFCSHH